jgi:hypothetical protein
MMMMMIVNQRIQIAALTVSSPTTVPKGVVPSVLKVCLGGGAEGLDCIGDGFG